MPELSTELSEREQEILRLVATGASNKEIAQQLYISVNTVKVHLRNIYTKIGVASRTEAAMYAVNSGLVPSGVSLPIQEGESSVFTPESQNEIAAAPAPGLWTRPLVVWASVGAIFFLLVGFFLIRSRLFPPVEAGESAPTAVPPEWQMLAPMSTARKGHAAAVYDDRIYVFGGETDDGITGAAERYDPDTDSWVPLREKPLPVKDARAAVLGGKIYVPGGMPDSGVGTDVLEIYDPIQDAWLQGASLPQAVYAYALATFEGKLYLFGGMNNGAPVGVAWEYDPTQDQWQELPPLPTPRGYACAVVSGRKVFIFGGSDGTQALTVNEILRPDLLNTPDAPWSTAAEMPLAGSGMGCVNLADILYLAGGENSSGEPIVSNLAYFPQSDSWQNYQTPDRAIGARPGVVNLGMNMFVLGGELNGAASQDLMSYRIMFIVSIPVINK